jgi:hypothetical protein
MEKEITMTPRLRQILPALLLLIPMLGAVPARAQLERVVADAKGIT